MRYKNTSLFVLILISFKLIPNPYCHISHPPYNAGFFSLFHTVLGALYLYEASNTWSGFKVDFETNGYYYQEEYGSNWWNYYFKPIKIGNIDKNNRNTLAYPKCMHLSMYAQFKVPRDIANNLIKKYIKIQPHIEQKLNEFTTTYFKKKFVLGIHYRGTDKNTEAPKVPYETVYQIIKRVLVLIRHPLLFVATDDENFLIYIKNKFPNLVIAQDDVLRSQDGTPIHSKNIKNNYKKGEEALLDCLILSRCNAIIKTSSNLSDASLKFNPTVPAITLNKSYIEDKL